MGYLSFSNKHFLAGEERRARMIGERYGHET
jgi:hypothetical protein